MRTETSTLFNEISNSHMNQLVQEVKETIATDMNHESNKTVFSAADLWNIQKMRRTRLQRRTIL